ncbi:MAG: LamG domain-containing protein [Fibromonadales bacterium]|nr:LamG domain-containing protein [Fibromonadales bacterium]
MKFLLIILALFVLSCAGTKKDVEKNVAGGTSEETNTLASSNVVPVVGRDGHNVTAVAFNNPNSYISSMEHGEKFSAAVAFDISVWLKIDSLPQKSGTPHNLIGKFSDASAIVPSEFSLAIVNGACGTEEAAFAFFFEDGSSNVDCGQALLSNKTIQAGKWIYVQAKWDGRYLTLYQDGVAVAKEERISAAMPYSRLPVYLGKSQVHFAIDGISFNTEAL